MTQIFPKKHEEQTSKANQILCCYYTNIDFIHYFTDEYYNILV